MSESPDLGQAPIAYPQGFVNIVAQSSEDATHDADEKTVSPSSQDSTEQLGKESLEEREVHDCI